MTEPGAVLPLGLALAALIAFCIARGAERAVLERHRSTLRLLLFLPMRSWRDGLDPVDQLTLRPLRRRSLAGLGALLTGSLVAAILSVQDEQVESAPPMTGVVSRPAPAPEVGPPQPRVAKAEEDPAEPPSQDLLEELRTPARLYGTAKVKPVYRAHEVEGARITNIEPTSFWALLGVREGDVVIEVHGDPVDTPADLITLMNGLERDEDVAVAVRGVDGEVRYLEFRDPYARRR